MIAEYVEGVLKYNFEADRFGIWQEDRGWYIDGLHCGMCFDVLDAGNWTPTRIEYGSDPEGWYLVGVQVPQLEGTRCRWLVGW